MITLESVTRTYGHFTAVDDVSFTARPGRVTGFIWLASRSRSASGPSSGPRSSS